MKILLCDDDSLNLRINQVYVEDYLEKKGIHNATIIAKSKIDLNEEYEAVCNVDIAILDINLNDQITGLNIAQFIKKKNPYVALIFITSYDSYALDAFQLHACGFLQKPVIPEEFNEVFTRAILLLNGLHITKMNRIIVLNSKLSVKEKNIYCIEKVIGTKDIQVTTNTDVYTFRATIKEIQKRLGDSFVRVSRNALINIHYIVKIENGMIELVNERTFPIPVNKEKEIVALCSRVIK